MLLAVVALIVLVLLIFTDSYNARMSRRLARDTAELSERITERSGEVIEAQSMASYEMEARLQAQSLDLLFAEVEASVDMLAESASQYARYGHDGSVRALPSRAFLNTSRRPRDMVMDSARGMEVSWAYPAWHAPDDAERGAVEADVARYARLRDPMVGLCQNHPHIVWAYAAFPSRALILTPGNGAFADAGDLDPVERDWYRQAMAYEGAKAVWQTPYIDAASGRLTVTCSKAFHVRDGTLAGVVAVDLSLSVLQHWLDGLAGEMDIDAFLFDRAGEIVHQHSFQAETGNWRVEFKPPAFKDAFGAADEPILADLAAMNSGVRLLRGPDGTRYVAYSPIPTVEWNLVLSHPNTALYALKLENREEIAAAFAEAKKTTDRRLDELEKWFMLSIVVVCLGVMAVVTWTLNWRMRRPIDRMIHDIRIVSTGNLAHRMSHDSDDELGELARAFDEMTEQLRRTRDQLREYSRTLEQRVNERTGELAQRNEELNLLYEEAEHSYMQLKAAQSQLVQHERMATLGQLVAGIAHEINNPVNFLINSVRPLRQVTGKIENVLRLYESAEGLSAEEMSERLRKIRLYKKQMSFDTVLGDMDSALELICQGAERTGQIVENLRVFSRTEQTTFKSVDLRRGLDITISLLAHHLKNRITVHKDYNEIPLVECNPGQINQVFMNLLSNAAQAIHGEGDIWIEVHKTGKYVRVRIRDSGVGIPEDHLYRIFEPFFTTKGEAQGTGLGLSITHNIIQEHGGTIEVRSEVNKGTEFTVSLPVVQHSLDGSGSFDDESFESSPGTTKQIPKYGDSEGGRTTRPERSTLARDSESFDEDERSEDTAEFSSGSMRPVSSDTYRAATHRDERDPPSESSDPSRGLRTTREMVPGEDPLSESGLGRSHQRLKEKERDEE